MANMMHCNSRKKTQPRSAFLIFKLCFQAVSHFMEPEYKYVNKIKENTITLRRYISISDPLSLDVIQSMFWDIFFLNVIWCPDQPSILNCTQWFSNFLAIFLILRMTWLVLSFQMQHEIEHVRKMWQIYFQIKQGWRTSAKSFSESYCHCNYSTSDGSIFFAVISNISKVAKTELPLMNMRQNIYCP